MTAQPAAQAVVHDRTLAPLQPLRGGRQQLLGRVVPAAELRVDERRVAEIQQIVDHQLIMAADMQQPANQRVFFRLFQEIDPWQSLGGRQVRIPGQNQTMPYRSMTGQALISAARNGPLFLAWGLNTQWPERLKRKP
jgi:hypothetical protein